MVSSFTIEHRGQLKAALPFELFGKSETSAAGHQMVHTHTGAQGAIKSNFNVLAHALHDHAAAANA